MSKVLVVATSRKTRGGITSVVKAHETGEQWKKFHCHWVQTHRDGPKWRKIMYFCRALGDYIYRLPFYDIVHIHISQPTSLKRKRLLLKLANLYGKRVIIHFHAFNIENTILGKSAKLYSKYFENADKIIVLSQWWKDQLIEHLQVSKDKIEILYNPCPKAHRDNQRKTKTILYAGTINDRKGYKDLIYAFAKISNVFPDWQLVFAGNGELQKAYDLAKSCGIADKVEFLGWVNGKEKEEAFNTASIFCLPSYAEGFPMAVLDAWAYGLPVVTTPVGGLPDVAIAGENMLLFEPGNVDQLSEKLRMLIESEELRNKLSSASSKFAQGEFHIDTITRKLSNIYLDL